MASSTKDGAPWTLPGYGYVHFLSVQASVDTRKGFFLLIKRFFFTNMALECWGHPAETGLEAAGGDMKRFFFTKIKVYFYQ